jgi:ParB-like chromosome segregation protein Spo0J
MSLNGSAPAAVASADRGRKTDQLASEITSEDNATTTANQELAVHPAANVFPLLGGEEFDALVADIREHGLKNPITLCHGAVIDGRNRVRACLAAGWSWRAIRGMCGELSGAGAGQIDDPVAYVISVNIHRRHLSAEQKAEMLAKLVAAQPEKSDRELAKQAGVSHPTIAKARRTAEATGKALPVEKRVGADGKARKRPAKKKSESPKGQQPLEPETKPEREPSDDQLNELAQAVRDERWLRRENNGLNRHRRKGTRYSRSVQVSVMRRNMRETRS